MGNTDISMDNLTITATDDSLKQSGIELVKSHLHMAKTTMIPSRQSAMIVWIENLSKEDMDKLEGYPEAERIQLPRYSKEGKLARRFQAFKYEGMLHGLSYAMQTMDVKPKTLARTEDPNLYWVWNRYHGKMKLCLVLSNMEKLDDDTEYYLIKDKEKTESTPIQSYKIAVKQRCFTKIPTEICIENAEVQEDVTKVSLKQMEEYNSKIEADMQTI